MSDPRPPFADDGDGLPAVGRGRRRTDAAIARRRSDDGGGSESGGVEPPARDVWDNAGDTDWRRPNYLVRRAIVVGLVVAVIAGSAVIIGRIIGDGSSGTGSGFRGGEWNSVVTVDDAAGTVVIANSQGEETNRFRLGLSSVSDSALIGATLISTDAAAVGVVRLDATAEITPADITTVEIASSGLLTRPSGTTQTVVAQDAPAARLVLVHGPTAEIIDTAETDTVAGARYDLTLARSDPSGRHVLVTDVGNFQSVLFSFDLETPSFFPGLALAVSDEFVVTAQNVGTSADVGVFDHAGERVVQAQTTSVRAGMFAEGKVVLVGIDGDITTMSLSNGDIVDVDNLSIGTVESGEVAVRGDRLVVVGTDGTAIIDANGTIVAELPGARPGTTPLDPLAARGSVCLVVEREAVGDAVGETVERSPSSTSRTAACKPKRSRVLMCSPRWMAANWSCRRRTDTSRSVPTESFP